MRTVGRNWSGSSAVCSLIVSLEVIRPVSGSLTSSSSAALPRGRCPGRSFLTSMRARPVRPRPNGVEPEQLPTLLEAAKVNGKAEVGRVLLGVLAGAGLRIGEALALRWRHVDLPTGTLHIVGSKTAAGVRSIDLTATLREELVLWKAATKHGEPDDYVLSTSSGRTQNPSNLRRDVLTPAVEAANAKDGIALLEEITFHSLRRTYASLRCACGDDVRYTAGQLGHEDPRFTLKTYTQATKRRERMSGPHLKAYDQAIEWAQMGTSVVPDPVPVPVEATKNPG
jgi:integrase